MTIIAAAERPWPPERSVRRQGRPSFLSGRGTRLSDAIHRGPTGISRRGPGLQTDSGRQWRETREIIASSQGDIGIGDINPSDAASAIAARARAGAVAGHPVSSVMFIIRKDLFDPGHQHARSVDRLKRPDDRKPIVSVSSLGGTKPRLGLLLYGDDGADQKK